MHIYIYKLSMKKRWIESCFRLHLPTSTGGRAWFDRVCSRLNTKHVDLCTHLIEIISKVLLIMIILNDFEWGGQIYGGPSSSVPSYSTFMRPFLSLCVVAPFVFIDNFHIQPIHKMYLSSHIVFKIAQNIEAFNFFFSLYMNDTCCWCKSAQLKSTHSLVDDTFEIFQPQEKHREQWCIKINVDICAVLCCAGLLLLLF